MRASTKYDEVRRSTIKYEVVYESVCCVDYNNFFFLRRCMNDVVCLL